MKQCWLDIRQLGENRDAVVEEALHQGLHAIVAADARDLAALPPGIMRVLITARGQLPDAFDGIDVLLAGPDGAEPSDGIVKQHPGVEFGRFVAVTDQETLQAACDSARN